MKLKNRVIAAALTGILALSLAACGQSASTSSTSSTSSASSASAASSSASESSSEKEVRVATVPNTSKPLAWQDENGQIQGYEYDILTEIDKLLEHYTLDIRAVSDELQDAMNESGEADLAAGGYYINATRQENFIIPETPTGASSILIYIRSEDKDKITSLDDIVASNYKLTPVTPSGGIYNALTAWNEEHDNALGEIPVQEGSTASERVQAVASGQYDALISPNNLGISDTIAELGLDVVAAAEPVQVNPTVLLIKKTETEFAAEVEAALEQLKADGTLTALSEKWYGEDIFQYLQ